PAASTRRSSASMRAPVIAAVGLAALLGAAGGARAQVSPGMLLVSSAANGNIYAFTPTASGTATDLKLVAVGTPALSSPPGVAVDRNGLLAVSDAGTRLLSRIDVNPAPGDPAHHAPMVQFSTITSTPRGVVALADGRVFVVDPGIAPPGVSSRRGITRFPVLFRVDLLGGLPGAAAVAGCAATPAIGKTLLPNCDPEGTPEGGNFFFPAGI